jgi:hypothetical protein
LGRASRKKEREDKRAAEMKEEKERHALKKAAEEESRFERCQKITGERANFMSSGNL